MALQRHGVDGGHDALNACGAESRESLHPVGGGRFHDVEAGSESGMGAP